MMEKKNLLLTIIIDIVAVFVFVIAVYMLMFKELNRWQNNMATIAVVIALPVIFYSIAAPLILKKYEKQQDEKLWDDAEEDNNK